MIKMIIFLHIQKEQINEILKIKKNNKIVKKMKKQKNKDSLDLQKNLIFLRSIK